MHGIDLLLEYRSITVQVKNEMITDYHSKYLASDLVGVDHPTAATSWP
jgi:hypothetical protein